ncbi:hypothetical protein Ocin01_13912 [Orchesella cincta]|uniref:Knottins-like domain-containing protein n=1 Tax=Orchesella cincta TaxID=48709 RepID=A0A1D2MIE5_ORCCI|nr:hypothetical protein Ocin01_13912 [Orchesella cincta]
MKLLIVLLPILAFITLSFANPQWISSFNGTDISGGNNSSTNVKECPPNTNIHPSWLCWNSDRCDDVCRDDRRLGGYCSFFRCRCIGC